MKLNVNVRVGVRGDVGVGVGVRVGRYPQWRHVIRYSTNRSQVEHEYLRPK